MRTIRLTPTEYAERIAELMLAAPEHTIDELALDHALDAACARIGIEPVDVVARVQQSAEIHMVEVPVATTVAVGEA